MEVCDLCLGSACWALGYKRSKLAVPGEQEADVAQRDPKASICQVEVGEGRERRSQLPAEN